MHPELHSCFIRAHADVQDRLRKTCVFLIILVTSHSRRTYIQSCTDASNGLYSFARERVPVACKSFSGSSLKELDWTGRTLYLKERMPDVTVHNVHRLVCVAGVDISAWIRTRTTIFEEHHQSSNAVLHQSSNAVHHQSSTLSA